MKTLEINKTEFETREYKKSAQEHRVLDMLRCMDYGELRIVVKDSSIVQIEEKKSHKL